MQAEEKEGAFVRGWISPRPISIIPETHPSELLAFGMYGCSGDLAVFCINRALCIEPRTVRCMELQPPNDGVVLILNLEQNC